MTSFPAPPPLPIRVAARYLCLFAISTRAKSDNAVQRRGADVDHARECSADITDYLQRICFPYLSSSELSALAIPIGQMPIEVIREKSWGAESAAVMAWALGLRPTLSAWDKQMEAYVEADGAYGPGITPDDVLRLSTIRSLPEVQELRDQAELWHWRARNEMLLRGEIQAYQVPGRERERPDYLGIAKASAQVAQMKGWIATMIDGDFPAFGMGYWRLSMPQVRSMASIAMERHKALNWLCGYEADWDKVTTDT